MLGVVCFLAVFASPILGARLPYIIGGHDVESPGSYPWQVSLQMYGNSHICGASVISSRWVLTAAHCVSYGPQYYTVVLGGHDITTQRQGHPVRYNIHQIIKHPGYRADGWQGFPNDIALMQLSKPAELDGTYAAAIEMAESGDNFEGQSCTITGWGRMIENGYYKNPNILQEAQIQVFKKSDCQRKWGSIRVGDDHVCVGIPNQKGSCNGDSGGPLTCTKGDKQVLVGATSWGANGCSTYYPSVYASVAHFRAWIKSTSGV